MIGRLPEPKDPEGWEGSSFVRCVSCALRPVTTDAAMAEPKKLRRLMDMHSPYSGNGQQDNTSGGSSLVGHRSWRRRLDNAADEQEPTKNNPTPGYSTC